MDQKALMITSWPPSFGHLADSLTVLADIYYHHRLNELGYKIALRNPPSQWSENIIDMLDILFGEGFINLSNVNGELVQFREVVLVHQHTNTHSFLSFPEKVISILQSAWDDREYVEPHNIFISRGTKNTHRILNNQQEVEEFFKAHGFLVLNPENMTNAKLFNIVKNARNVIITNGSALATLMVFFRNHSRIFCLNSAGYQPEWRRNITSAAEMPNDADQREDFEKGIWKNAISRFNFTYVDSFLNRITDQQLHFISKNILPS
jgi:capsular polysaccharide biosynthesis protein